jgi:TRAP-type uncharacterized transport system substrate-binding protein
MLQPTIAFMWRYFMIIRVTCGALLGLLTMLSWGDESVAPSKSQDMVISSGTKGGGYWSAASRLQAVVEGKGGRMENLPSAGSLANLESLADPDSEVNLAFAQADALEYFLYEKSEARAQVSVMEYLGQECVFIVTTANSNLHTDRDLQKDNGYRLGIASHTSGVAVTFNNMTRRVPELSNVEVVYGEKASIEQLRAPNASVDALMVVHRPKEHSEVVDLVLGDPERYRFLKISDDGLTEKSVDGQEVYRAMKLAIPGKDDRPPSIVNTICVKGLFLVNQEKLNYTQQNVLNEVVNSHWGAVFATQ